MRIDAVSSVPQVEIAVGAKGANLDAGQSGSQSAPKQQQAASTDDVRRSFASDNKTIVYQILDTRGDVIEQIPSQEILAIRQDIEKLAQAADQQK